MHEAMVEVECPSLGQYDEAIMQANVCLRTGDADLRQGHVVMAAFTNQLGAEAAPWKHSGAFAVVYQFRTAGGKRKALRCFTTLPSRDIAERYALLGPYLQARAAGITLGFDYATVGILVPLPDESYAPFPLQVMDWADGRTLCEALEAYCAASDVDAIGRLYRSWTELLLRLHDEHLAHGDLAGGNVLVMPDDTLVLVDYDGFYVPPLQGREAVVDGQPDYQHPARQPRPYNEHMDDFSSLLITTALLALRAAPTLWRQFSRYDAEGKLQSDHLLFTRQDLREPAASEVFQALARLEDPLIQRALHALWQACSRPAKETPFVLGVLDPAFGLRRARQTLQQAQADVDAMLDQGRDEEALRRATQAFLIRHDSRFLLAQRRFLATQQPAQLLAWVAGKALEVHWTWPPSTLVDTVAVLWSASGPPLKSEQAGVQAAYCRRSEYLRQNGFHAMADGEGPLYVRVFAALALPLPPSTTPISARFVEVPEFGITITARAPCHVSCRLLKRRGADRNALELHTADGGPLPPLIVVRMTGALPLRPEEGVIVSDLGAATQPPLDRRRIDLDVRGWPRQSVLRVFPKHEADGEWVHIEGDRGVKLEVT